MLRLKNMEEFSREIEKLVTEKKLTYLEATIEHLGKFNIDVDNAKLKNVLSPKIQQKIYDEAVEYNMLGRGKKKKKLPLK
jgi:hypothetical protein